MVAIAVGTAAAVLAAGGAIPATAAPKDAEPAPGDRAVAGTKLRDLPAGDYIVTMAGAPVASYDGGVAGLPATRAARGKRLDPAGPAATRYRRHLLDRQRSTLREAGVAPRVQYSTVFNGFAARLTAAQATELAAAPDVVSVTPDGWEQPQVYDTGTFLGLTAPGTGTYAQLGGEPNAGKGVVIGVLDTGIWPENPFFAGEPVTATAPDGVGSTYRDPQGRIAVAKSDGGTFTGVCEEGPRFPATTCNSKIVGARVYSEAFEAAVPAAERGKYEFLSPRDGEGHGSHTASIAAGARIPEMTAGGRTVGPAAGMAPAAKIAVYKVCWQSTVAGKGGCRRSALLQAFEDAVADGVDVINYSLTSSWYSPANPVGLAQMNAAAAGILVAAAAGNDGGRDAINNAGPWVTTVGATTARPKDSPAVRLGDGRVMRGVSRITQPLSPAPAVLAEQAPADGVAAARAARCLNGTLDPAEVRGKIVVCDRDGTMVDASVEVQRAGGTGMVLVNDPVLDVRARTYTLPTIHLAHRERTMIRGYVTGAVEPTVALLPAGSPGVEPAAAPVLSSLSSRGPTLSNGGDLVKPDLVAPGEAIWSADAPNADDPDDFIVVSGTSMSAPHVAGFGALILTRYPRWSPAAVKSAMMTTAGDVLRLDGSVHDDANEVGAGFVNPRRFLEPGLVFDSGAADWLAFLEGTGYDTGSGTKPIDPSDLNLPSIAVTSLVGRQTVTRTVTAVADGTWTARGAVPGLHVSVSPTTITLKKGETAQLAITLTHTTAELGVDTTGQLVLDPRDDGTAVRAPIAVRPARVEAPASLRGEGVTGSLSYRARVPEEQVDLVTGGLVAPTDTAASVQVGPALSTPTANEANRTFTVTVPEGIKVTRIDAVGERTTDDVDLYVYDSTGRRIGDSLTLASSESVSLPALAPGTYTAQVNGFAGRPAGEAMPFTLRTFLVGDQDSGNLTVSPDPVRAPAGSPVEITVSWRDLRPGTPYAGWIRYGTGPELTMVTVN